MKTPKAWNVFEYFCDLLQQKFKNEFEQPSFDESPISNLPLSKSLFQQFKSFTTKSKDFKGFPTTKGYRKTEKGIPVTTKIPKDHPDILRMFENYFNANTKGIKLAIDDEIKKFPNMKDSIKESGDVVDVEYDDDDDGYEEEFDFTQVKVKEELSEIKEDCKRKEVDHELQKPAMKIRKVETISTNTKIHHEQPNHAEKTLVVSSNQVTPANLTKNLVVSIKREAKASITEDEHLKDKAMPKTSSTLQKIRSLINENKPIIEKELHNIQLEKEKLLQELEAKEKNIKEGTLAHLQALEGLANDMVNYIDMKSKEYAALEVQEEEELDDFFLNTLKKPKATEN